MHVRRHCQNTSHRNCPPKEEAYLVGWTQQQLGSQMDGQLFAWKELDLQQFARTLYVQPRGGSLKKEEDLGSAEIITVLGNSEWKPADTKNCGAKCRTTFRRTLGISDERNKYINRWDAASGYSNLNLLNHSSFIIRIFQIPKIHYVFQPNSPHYRR